MVMGSTDDVFARVLRRPTIIELIERMFLNKYEYRLLFEGHDPGDEDPRTRRYGRMVCSLRPGRHCTLPPGHLGPHEEQVT